MAFSIAATLPEGDAHMATIVKAGDRPPLNILGMPLRMLCEAKETGGA
jgi:hypothetical protein